VSTRGCFEQESVTASVRVGPLGQGRSVVLEFGRTLDTAEGNFEVEAAGGSGTSGAFGEPALRSRVRVSARR